MPRMNATGLVNAVLKAMLFPLDLLNPSVMPSTKMALVWPSSKWPAPMAVLLPAPPTIRALAVPELPACVLIVLVFARERDPLKPAPKATSICLTCALNVSNPGQVGPGVVKVLPTEKFAVVVLTTNRPPAPVISSFPAPLCVTAPFTVSVSPEAIWVVWFPDVLLSTSGLVQDREVLIHDIVNHALGRCTQIGERG